MAHYAEDYKARCAPKLRGVGGPLPQGARSRPAQPLSDPLAHRIRQEEDDRGHGGHRILQGVDPADGPPLQRRWAGRPRRSSSPKPRGERKGAAKRRAKGRTPRSANEAPARRGDVELAQGRRVDRAEGRQGAFEQEAKGMGVPKEARPQPQGPEAPPRRGRRARARGFKKGSR